MSATYAEFLERKSQMGGDHGFAPTFRPGWLFDFQSALVEWAVTRGRAAIFADCGLGKTAMQLAWAQNIHEHTNRPVLILTPLAVGAQTVAEGEKFGIRVERSRDGQFTSRGIIVTNYEKLHLFDPSDFVGVVCDESSILKHFTGATQKNVTRFMAKLPYRLLCTATAAPNDYIELGTSAEALGELVYSDMLSRFFRLDENKPHRMDEVRAHFKSTGRIYGLDREVAKGEHYAKLAYRVSQAIGQWRLKGHAVTPFWQWVASWARACRMPSDLGFDDGRFHLPALQEREHIVVPDLPPEGYLFEVPAIGLRAERDERRRTLDARCELVARLVDHDRPAVVWCHMNREGDRLAEVIRDGLQISGSDSDEEKEEAYRAFASGQLRVLITKPKIGAWGLNWQHCAHVVTFASHSYEQFYQSVRRCWRFGQQSPVVVDIIATEGERHVRENMSRKAAAADAMFAQLVTHMQTATRLARTRHAAAPPEVPSWL